MPNIGRKASANSIGVVKRIEPPHSERISAVRMITDGIEMIIVVVWKNVLIVVPMPVRNMWWAQTMNDMKPRKIERVDHRLVAPQRLARVVGDDLGDDADAPAGSARRPPGGPGTRTGAARAAGCRRRRTSSDLAADHEAGRQEEAGAGHAVHQLQDAGGLQRREGQQQQERGHELRPDEERQPHPGQARRPQLDDGGDEVDRRRAATR